jgi:hypothetical protein
MKATMTMPIAKYEIVVPMLKEKRPTPPRMIKIRTAIIAFLFISSALPKLLCKGNTYPNYHRIAQACGVVKNKNLLLWWRTQKPINVRRKDKKAVLV